MPLSVTVGLSKKTSRQFNSLGASLSISAELETALLADSQALQQRIAGLYEQARLALENQLQAMCRSNPEGRPSNGNPNGPDPPPPQTATAVGSGPMTSAQRRTILAISRRLGVDPEQKVRELFGKRSQDLRAHEASRLIDHLDRADPTPAAQTPQAQSDVADSSVRP